MTIDSFLSDLLGFDWQEQTADFVIPDDPGNVLRVRFRSSVIVRMLDEFPLRIESNPATWEGLVPHHLAYRVEGATFAVTQSDVWKELERGVTHYRFVTGNGCLDVLSAGDPEFAIVPTAS